MIFVLFGLLITGANAAFAQSRSNDSATRARQQALEITRAAQKRSLDSAKTARQHALDSVKVVRQKRTDSMQALRKYRESRRFKDSVTNERKDKIAAIREAQQARLDSMRDARQRVTDSMIAAREAVTSQLHKTQQRRTDSLNAIKKYRTSKRFADSVAIVKRARADSLTASRKARTDSMTAARNANIAKMKAARKVISDSMAAVRKQHSDSLTAKRKEREALAAKKKDQQTRDKKQKENDAAKKTQIAFELKIKKKRSVYSNENMLKKKWSAPRRAVQNTFTHYNYYFNANKKMEEAEANMQRTAKDNWDEPIALYSFDPLRDSASFAADMDSVIQHTSLGIQIHDPRTKWGDDLYLLLGKAYFYKGDFDNSTASFKYIVALQEKAKAEAAKKAAYSNKTVHGKRKEMPSIVVPEQKGINAVIKREPATNEGLLWLARAYTAYNHPGEAESILDLVANDPKFPESLRGELALQKGFLAVKQHNDKEAASELQIASADKSIDVNTRRRAAYLAGQLLQDQHAYTQAASQYALVSDLHPKIDMDFYARRNRAYALMQAGGVQKDAIASLKSMLSDGKFAPYYEQIYYVLGRLSANAANTDEAVAYLKKGLSSTKTTRKQKAISFAALGNMYFTTGAYPEAKLAYDSVSRFAPAAPDDSGVALAMRRAPLVDRIALPAYIIRQQDSLIALGELSEKEQRAVVRRYLKVLQARKADSVFNAENAGVAAAAVKDNADANGGGDLTAASWYFSNPAMIQQGITDFKRKWGNRPLSDNWRRIAAISTTNTPGTIADANNDVNNGSGTYELDQNGLPTEEALMAVIPTTPEARAVATGRLQKAYVEMATAYVRQFEDYTRATITLDTFDKRWTLNPYTAEATFLRYQISLRRNDLKEAQKWSTKLQKEFPGTQWANFVAPAPNEAQESGPATASVSDFYDITYNLLQERQYGEVLNRTRTARRQYTDEVYGNRFRIVEAMAYAGSAQYKEADTILNDFIRTHKDDALKPWAEEVLRYVGDLKKADTLNRKPDSTIAVNPNTAAATIDNNTVTNLAPWTGIAAPPVDTNKAPIPDEYTYKPSEPHYFVFGVNKMETKAMGVKAALADLNIFKFSTTNLQTDIIPLKGGRAMVVVKTFNNAAAARTYLSTFRDARIVVREFMPGEYESFVISASNYRKMVKDGSFAGYLPFFRSHY